MAQFFESLNAILRLIEMKVIEQSFPVVLFIILCWLILTLEHLNKRYREILFCATVLLYDLQGGINF